MFQYVKEKLNKKCVIIACLHFILTFFTDTLIFDYSLSDFSSLLQAGKSLLAIGSKVAFFFILILSVYYLLEYQLLVCNFISDLTVN